MGDVGIILESGGNNDVMIGGTLPQRITSCLATLDLFLSYSHAVTSSFVMADKVGPKSTSNKKVNLLEVVANVLGKRNETSPFIVINAVEVGVAFITNRLSN